MFLADLHIHSHYARATSRQLVAGQKCWRYGAGAKDRWRASVPATLPIPAGGLSWPTRWIEAEPGLYRLRPELAMPDDWHVPHIAELARFVLSCEISSIYKKTRQGAQGAQRDFAARPGGRRRQLALSVWNASAISIRMGGLSWGWTAATLLEIALGVSVRRPYSSRRISGRRTFPCLALFPALIPSRNALRI